MDIPTLQRIALQYYGIDWMVMITGFVATYGIGSKWKAGFLFGIVSAIFGVFFSILIGSIANGLTSVVFCVLYLRGYLLWKK